MELLAEVEIDGERPWLCRAERIGPDELLIRSAALELGVAGDALMITVFGAGFPTRVRAEIVSARKGVASVRVMGRQAASASPTAG